MKIISWNVNGIRSVARKGWRDWLERERPDVLALQETKAEQSQLDAEILNPLGYGSLFHSAKKKGYSGVALYFKKDPSATAVGLNEASIDSEGRVLSADFGEITVVNAYFPNSQREHARLPYKLEFCKKMEKHCQSLRAKGRTVVLCGDYNIAHHPIDLRNPKENEKNAGFLPEERAWMDRFTGLGYVDVFRRLHPGEGGHYTWWSYRPGIRERNIGWRIDYFCINPESFDRVRSMRHQPETQGSDHCPIEIQLRLS